MPTAENVDKNEKITITVHNIPHTIDHDYSMKLSKKVSKLKK